MSFPTGSANPYEAPAVDVSPVSLADDTEFLFNDKVIAGNGKISLPEICVVTGTRESLFRRTSTFRWCSRWITVSRNILVLLSFVVLISSQVGGIGPPVKAGTGIEAVFTTIKYAVASTIVVGTGAFVILSLLMRETITVEWSISRASVQRYRRIWAAGILTAIGLMAASEFAVFSLNFPRFLTMALVGTCIAVASMYAKLAGQDPLAVLGRFNGLFLIGGFREPFLTEVQTLAAMRSSRESGTVPKPD
ncbi:MAG: hypothetical protein NT138_23540 [Planctomycetales bacterium]|nr:hypothetical protein [Planctomycetales bacterium]